MCLEITKQGLKKLEQIRKTGKTVTVYKVLRRLDDKLVTPYTNTTIKAPGIVHSNRRRTNASHSCGENIHRGLHFFTSMRQARLESAAISECDGRCHQIWEVEVEPDDIIAIGSFSYDLSTNSLAAYKAKFIRRIVRK
jgi:hypothetical protein